MTTGNLYQLPVEVLRTNTNVSAQVNQVIVEVLRPNQNENAELFTTPPKAAELEGMGMAFGGQPFVATMKDGTQDLTLDFAFAGQPFVTRTTYVALPVAATNKRHTKPYRFNLGSSRGRSYRYRG